MYVISSPASTFSPLAGVDSLLAITFGLFTVTSTSSVGVPSTSAVFSITFVNPLSSAFTLTSKLMLAVPATVPSFAGTFTVIPLFKFVSV